MLARLFVFFPGLDRVLAKGFPLFFSVNVLGDCFSQNPIGRLMACLRQVLNPGTGIHIKLYSQRFVEDGGVWHGFAPKMF